MNAISGFSQLLLQTALNESQQEYVQAISSSSENLLVIINDILDFSKITSGKFEIEYRQYNFRKSIQDVINTLKPLISQKKLLFEVQIDEQVPEYIRACPSRINQVLINLIGNALKFTKEGTVLVEVNVKDAKFLLFKVKDTGIGIAEEKIESIFESFTQAEKYITRMYGGTGLGLSISKKLVELMGGNIAVQSKIGEGSVFYFNIPFETVAAQASIKNEINKAENTNKRMKILIVEDNRINQKLVITILNGMNCVCDLAEDGQKAVAMASESHYDLIFMDIQMPIMDGMEATRLIRERDKEIPIVAMTAHSLEHEKQLCFNLGMNDYLTKPFRREDLLKIVSKYALGEE
jgi:CheY-like chemotaxis protein